MRARPRGQRARTWRKFKKGKGKDLGPQNYGHVCFHFFLVLLLPPHPRPVPLLLCCALVCRDYCCCAAVALLVRCCRAAIPAPPCAACGPEKPPHFSLFKSYNAVDFFPILCFWGTLPKSTIFARARPPPLIFPFSFFEFSRSACAPQRGPRARTWRKFKNGKRKNCRPQNYGPIAILCLYLK